MQFEESEGMTHRLHITRVLAVLLAICCCGGVAVAQNPLEPSGVADEPIPFGPSDPSVEPECGQWQWPEVRVPCPEVQIKQKHDHTPMKQYQAQGWDTVVTCSQKSLILSCMPYAPVQYFNGQYTVDTIAYNPVDPTFARGTKMPVTTDDDFAADTMAIPFPFYFFGELKTSFVLGANGLITFNADAAGKYCPWRYTQALPWPGNPSGAPHALDCTVNHMRDAIYGIYEDTHPIASYLSGDQGIYYGIQGEAPCRKIVCSWNGIPVYPGSRNRNNRCTYQIVCYEGSNIIEVHIKRRGINSSWQGAHGLIGIQNATGQPLTRGEQGSTLQFVDTGYAAYYPTGGNMLTTALDSIAFRFTPVGNPNANFVWYRIEADGSAVELGNDVSSTEDYCDPMGHMTTCPTLTLAYVRPTRTTRYVAFFQYTDASRTNHIITDTITIGMDTAHALTLRPQSGRAGDTVMDICSGTAAALMVEYPPLQDTTETELRIWRRRGGADVPLADTLLRKGVLYEDEVAGLKRMPAILTPDSIASNLRPGDIDSVYIQLKAYFVSGCDATQRLLVRTFPAYDTVVRDTICQGERYLWALDGQEYTTSTTSPRVTLPTMTGCDSTVHLHLTVSPLSETVDQKEDCKTVVWHGRSYSESNHSDTVHLRNMAGCDSLVHLDLSITPLSPRIEADLDHFDLDHLDVVLTDATSGGGSRRILAHSSSWREPPVADARREHQERGDGVLLDRVRGRLGELPAGGHEPLRLPRHSASDAAVPQRGGVGAERLHARQRDERGQRAVCDGEPPCVARGAAHLQPEGRAGVPLRGGGLPVGRQRPERPAVPAGGVCVYSALCEHLRAA